MTSMEGPRKELGPQPLPAAALRWRCPADDLDFETTAEVEPIPGVVGQPAAVAALRFALECEAPGQNVFVRGLTGTGRTTMVGRLLEELEPACRAKLDRCYVHDFCRPERPRLVSLPAGRGRAFRRRLAAFAEFVENELPEALGSDAVRAHIAPLEERQRSELEALVQPFEEELRAAGLALVSLQMGPMTRLALFPRFEGQPVEPEKFEELHAEGKIGAEEHAAWHERMSEFSERLQKVSRAVARARRAAAEAMRALIVETARSLVREPLQEIRAEFPGEGVEPFLAELEDDVVENRLGPSAPDAAPPAQLYSVNVLLEHEDDARCPVVIEHAPSVPNLLGSVDRPWGPHGPQPSDHRMIRGGALLRADGGFLVLDARDVLSEPGAWKMLLRTLRTGMLEIVPAEMLALFGAAVKPEPIPVRLRVILLGDALIYHLLDENDPDFAHLFKVLADFDTVIDREPDGVRHYAGVLARIAREEGLPPFHRSAVAALAEHGARIAARRGKLTARLARVADIAREAAFLAARTGEPDVSGERVFEAVRRTRERGSLPSRRFQELLEDGTIHMQARGSSVGQVNGLAVIHAGPLTYGFPARITASIGPGSAGLIDIEGRSALSGSIHTKGFHILGGLLRELLRTAHPLAFSASLAFEQSYGGIDGDSASGAEICCLISALTGVPLRQDLAITGAIDQKGHLQAVGGVNEKTDGFFDTCRGAGLTGTQGVIIPRANAGDLMLRSDVVEAAERGDFHVYAVDTVHEALELFTGLPAGERDAEGVYPEESLLWMAVAKAEEYWVLSSRNPTMVLAEEEEPQPEEEKPEEAAAE